MPAASVAANTRLAGVGGRRRATPQAACAMSPTLAAGMFNALLHRAHVGGYPNVLLAWTPLAATAVGVGASRVINAAGVQRTLVEALVLGGTLLGLMSFSFDPDAVAPGPADDRYGDRIRALVARYEAHGDVIVTSSGSITRRPHYHSAALFDVLRANDPPPADLLSGLQSRSYAAMLVTAPNDAPCAEQHCGELQDLVMRTYFVAARIPDPERSAMVGFDAHPRWLLLPRTRVDLSLGREALERRQRRETAIAVQRQIDETADGHEDEVEDLAQRASAP